MFLDCVNAKASPFEIDHSLLLILQNI